MKRSNAPPGLARWAARCLWLYPRAWRVRYQKELLALLEHHSLTLWTLADLLLGAVDAHLHRSLLPLEVFTMTQRIRTSANAILVSFLLFFISWVMVPFIADSPGTWNTATANHPEIGYALAAFQVGGAVAVLALLVGGLPLVGVTSSGAWRRQCCSPGFWWPTRSWRSRTGGAVSREVRTIWPVPLSGYG